MKKYIYLFICLGFLNCSCNESPCIETKTTLILIPQQIGSVQITQPHFIHTCTKRIPEAL